MYKRYNEKYLCKLVKTNRIGKAIKYIESGRNNWSEYEFNTIYYKYPRQDFFMFTYFSNANIDKKYRKYFNNNIANYNHCNIKNDKIMNFLKCERYRDINVYYLMTFHYDIKIFKFLMSKEIIYKFGTIDRICRSYSKIFEKEKLTKKYIMYYKITDNEQ